MGQTRPNVETFELFWLGRQADETGRLDRRARRLAINKVALLHLTGAGRVARLAQESTPLDLATLILSL